MKHDLQSSGVSLLGLPTDVNSSFQRGAAEAPARIRAVLHDGSSNLCSEMGIDLHAHPLFRDAGDLAMDDDEHMPRQVEGAVADLLAQGERVLSLGGDHAVTFPIVKAYARLFPRLTVVHFDAHPDLYDLFDENPSSHASPFARILEAGLVSRLIQIGIRTMNDHQRAQARRFGVEVHEMARLEPGLRLSIEGPVYVSLDLDALDPSCAPGVSHQEPGGLTTREVLQLLGRVDAPIVGADIVEYNPRFDLGQMTGRVAAKFVKELASAMIVSLPRGLG